MKYNMKRWIKQQMQVYTSLYEAISVFFLNFNSTAFIIKSLLIHINWSYICYIRRRYDKIYTDDLTDTEWNLIKDILPKQKTGRQVIHDLREMLNAILYLVRTWYSWRNLPKDFPNWQAVYSRFKRWKALGIYDKIYEL